MKHSLFKIIPLLIISFFIFSSNALAVDGPDYSSDSCNIQPNGQQLCETETPETPDFYFKNSIPECYSRVYCQIGGGLTDSDGDIDEEADFDCTSGTCSCSSGTISCDNDCQEPFTDINNCGNGGFDFNQCNGSCLNECLDTHELCPTIISAGDDICKAKSIAENICNNLGKEVSDYCDVTCSCAEGEEEYEGECMGKLAFFYHSGKDMFLQLVKGTTDSWRSVVTIKMNGENKVDCVDGQVPTWDIDNAEWICGDGGKWKTGDDPNNIYYDSGRVGVGTNEPESILHVASDKPIIIIEDTDGTDDEGRMAIRSANNDTNINDGLYIQGWDPLMGSGGDWEDLVYVDRKTGKMGVGTDNPGTQLHVDGDLTVDKVNLQESEKPTAPTPGTVFYSPIDDDYCGYTEAGYWLSLTGKTECEGDGKIRCAFGEKFGCDFWEHASE